MTVEIYPGVVGALLMSGCVSGRGSAEGDGQIAPEAIPSARVDPEPTAVGDEDTQATDPFAAARAAMVHDQLAGRDISDSRVLAAMGRIPRHRFVPDGLQANAYGDYPVPIGHDVTISQPYIVALMTQLADVSPGERVLDVGTGSGYQAAVLAELGAEVWSMEIIGEHADAARQRLAALGYERIHVRHGDGYGGWPEEAPFDAIVVAAAAPEIPPALLEQLALGGRLVIPVGPRYDQSLELVIRGSDGDLRRSIAPVRFVPLVGGD